MIVDGRLRDWQPESPSSWGISLSSQRGHLAGKSPLTQPTFTMSVPFPLFNLGLNPELQDKALTVWKRGISKRCWKFPVFFTGQDILLRTIVWCPAFYYYSSSSWSHTPVRAPLPHRWDSGGLSRSHVTPRACYLHLPPETPLE